MVSGSGTNEDKYGINMRTWCREHEEQVQNHLLSFRGAREAQASLRASEKQPAVSDKQPIASGDQFSTSGEPLLTPEELLRLHRTKIQYLQHERLVHLIVLVMTVFGELFTIALVLALPETVPYSLIAMYGVLILLAFYFRHYFLLENTVQHWYRLDDEILEEVRKMRRAAVQRT